MLGSTLTMTGCGEEEVKIYDKENRIFASVQGVSLDNVKLEDEGYRAYIDIVLEEAVGCLQEKYDCDKEEATKKLFNEKYAIYTSFDRTAYEAMKKTYSSYEEDKVSFGCAATDTKGNLIAAYGAGDFKDGYRNYATARTEPYSSFKPLSVYAPAIDAGIASWSKTYEDSPTKQVKDEDGTVRDWPANAGDTYSNEKVCVVDAVRYSLNTVAVRCLQEYGVANSMQYLKQNFNVSLAFEETRLLTLGEEEIVGNIALGYLYDGVSPVEMAGYYQSFANGGIYSEPKAVTKICDENGKMIYELQHDPKQVMGYETAFVMNQLLQRVVSKGATGEKARCENAPVGGKTGSGSTGNWFVGFTPEYTCAVWHGTEMFENHAAKMFAGVVSGFVHNEEVKYPECNTIKIAAYCVESGGLYTKGCRKIDRGYYTSIDTTEKCGGH